MEEMERENRQLRLAKQALEASELAHQVCMPLHVSPLYVCPYMCGFMCMYLYACPCMCVLIYVCLYVRSSYMRPGVPARSARAHAHTHTHTYTHAHARTHARTLARTLINVHM
jgi:hypothetical protein